MRKVIYILVALLFVGIGVLTMMGEVQKVIKFNGAANEMVFTLLSLFIGIIALMDIKK